MTFPPTLRPEEPMPGPGNSADTSGSEPIHVDDLGQHHWSRFGYAKVKAVLQLLVTLGALVVATFSSDFEKRARFNLTQASKNATREPIFERPVNETKSVSDILKSNRRAPRFGNKAASTAYVKVFNSQGLPGTKETFYNYETRGNTSAHSGELWDTFSSKVPSKIHDAPYIIDHFPEATEEGDRSDVDVKDILRVKPKTKENTKTDTSKTKISAEIPSYSRYALTTTKSPGHAIAYPASKLGNQKEGYIVYEPDDRAPKSGLSTGREETQPQISTEKTVLKDASHWKVVGDGGEEGWQVVDDKGEVEWKIEYDDGEWRVISTGDFPSDAEWANPDYAWEPSESSGNFQPEYNAWQPDDYNSPPSWANGEVYYTRTSNDSWPENEDKEQKKDDESSRVISSGWKPDAPSSASHNANEKIQFGARRNAPTKTPDTSRLEEETDAQIPEEKTNDISIEENPRNDHVIFVGKSWIQQPPAAKSNQKWIQDYGSKSWESDSAGWNSKTSGETWVSAEKNYATDPWIPKIPDSQQEITPTEENNAGIQEKSIQAWGTGYGTKTWKGAEWDSNVVWKTGVNSNLPWSDENSTWQFPEANKEKKKPEVWSQPIPTNAATSSAKSTPPPNKRSEGIHTKWPVRPVDRENSFYKSPPSRRTESESSSDDDSTGGVVWKQDESDDTIPTDQKFALPKSYGWQTGGWKVGPSENQQTAPAAWKNNAPPKSSNLVNINWKTGGANPLDSTAVAWNQDQWPGTNLEPTWIFQGCKMTLKCGTNDEITNDNHQSTLPDTSDDDTVVSTTTTAAPIINIGKGWPPKQNIGKSWKPPSKTWKAPKWKNPTPAPTTTETMSPAMKMKATPKPKINWKKPTPNMWKQPPTTMMWTETTPEPSEMTWKPPPPPMKWKKIPKPTKSWKPPPPKSWKPPPTKSWKPPKRPIKTWPSPIATPQPDTWPTTKPDCKDTADATQPPQKLNEDDELNEPPQIIIITKLPKNSPPTPSDKKDKDGAKTKPSSGPWVFPPRKYYSKYSKNRKDKNIPISSAKWQMNRPPRTNYKQINVNKGWQKGMPSTKFPWSSSAMRRWTTKKPISFTTWKSKYPKPRSWKEMLKKLMTGL